MLRKKVNTEVEKVRVCHELGYTVITTLTLRGLGECGACRSFLG